MKVRLWSLYIIETEKNTLYTGITKDIERRFCQHLDQKGGAKYFRSTRPKQILFVKGRLTHSEALKLEYQIKQWSRLKKLEWIAHSKKIKTKKVKVLKSKTVKKDLKKAPKNK